MNKQKCEYELRREENIKEKVAYLETLKNKYPVTNPQNIVHSPSERDNVITPNSNRKSKDLYQKLKEFIPVRRSSRLKRSRSCHENDDFDIFEVIQKRHPIRIRLKSRREVNRQPRVVPSVDLVTQADLSKIATKLTDKIYSSTGTTCHQCRQKTLDTKTICRSETCVGIRGQFCGMCLKNRYGEDAATCLLARDWICPPCRNICNCSFCRAKAGKPATGILTPSAKSSGYNSVHDYLVANGDDDDDDIIEDSDINQEYDIHERSGLFALS